MGSYFSNHSLGEAIMRQVLRSIGRQVGAVIKQQYPFRDSTSAARAFIDFEPRTYAGSYEALQMDCREIFLRAYICSILQRGSSHALRGMTRMIREQSLLSVINSLRDGEYLLPANETRYLMEIIRSAEEEFNASLMEVASKREHAKMIFINLLSKGNQVDMLVFS